MGAGAAHLAYSYSPTMGHGVPRPAPKADSPTALFRAHLERHRDPSRGSLLRLEDLLGVPLSLRLGPTRGREAHPRRGEEWCGDGDGDGSRLSKGRAAVRDLQELRREVRGVRAQLGNERQFRGRITRALLQERERWHLEPGIPEDAGESYRRKLYANPHRDSHFGSDVEAVADSICGYVRCVTVPVPPCPKHLYCPPLSLRTRLRS